MSGRIESDPGGARRSVELSAWRQVAVFAVAAVSVVVFVRLGRYLGQRFGVSPPLTAALVPIVPTVGAALITKNLLTPGAKEEEKKSSYIDWIDNIDGVTRYAEWTDEGSTCNQLTVRLSVQKGVGGIYASDDAIVVAAEHLLNESKLGDYVVADEKTIHVMKFSEEHISDGQNSVYSGELTFTLQGYKPKDLDEAKDLVKGAWPLNISNGGGTAQFFDGKDDPHLWVSLPATADDVVIKRVAQNMVLQAARKSYKPSDEQSIKRDDQQSDDRLVYNIRGYQPRTEAEAEAVIRRAIAGKKR